MTLPDYADDWRDYWETAAESGRRLQIERAAADPVGRFLTADVPALVDDEIGIDAEHLRDHPDTVLADAREGFAAFVQHSDLPVANHSSADADRDVHSDGYGSLPVHLTAVGRVDWLDVAFENPVDDANALTTMRNARVAEGATRRTEAAVLTYRCPAGHETTVRQPLLRPWTLETCGESGCTHAVVPVDARTRARRIATFAVETPAGTLPCVAPGRYATVDDVFDRLASASALQLTGIARLVTDETGSIDPTYEVLAAEPTSS